MKKLKSLFRSRRFWAAAGGIGTAIGSIFPIYSEDAYAKRIDLSDLIIKNPYKTYFVESCNNHFVTSSPESGSILIIEKDRAPVSGQIVLAWLEGEFIVRKYLMKNVYPRLVCENEDYPDIEVEPDMEFWVWGVVLDYQSKRF